MKKEIVDKMHELGHTDNEMDEVLDNPETLFIANRIIKRLCRKCKNKVTINLMKYNLQMKREWLCDSCKRIHDFEINEVR